MEKMLQCYFQLLKKYNFLYLKLSDGTTVYNNEHFKINKFIQPIIASNSEGKTTLSTGIWLGLTSTAGLQTGGAVLIACVGNTSQHACNVVGGALNPIDTWSGNTITVTSSGIGLPVNWFQITDKYWF